MLLLFKYEIIIGLSNLLLQCNVLSALTAKSLLLFGPGPCLVVILVLCLPGALFGCVFSSDWLAYLCLVDWPTWSFVCLLAHSALTLQTGNIQAIA